MTVFFFFCTGRRADFLHNKTIHNVNKAAAEGGIVKIRLRASGFVALWRVLAFVSQACPFVPSGQKLIYSGFLLTLRTFKKVMLL